MHDSCAVQVQPDALTECSLAVHFAANEHSGSNGETHMLMHFVYLTLFTNNIHSAILYNYIN